MCCDKSTLWYEQQSLMRIKSTVPFTVSSSYTTIEGGVGSRLQAKAEGPMASLDCVPLHAPTILVGVWTNRHPELLTRDWEIGICHHTNPFPRAQSLPYHTLRVESEGEGAIC